MKKFDLNIESILENWEVYHALRELIANAIDEQYITNSKDIEIFKEKEIWHIRDYGRGLKYTHLTQNENDEKLSNPNVIGKFGIGLKDALATFDRHGVVVEIKSKYGIITTERKHKEEFQDICTLHAIIYPCEDTNFVGTDISILGIKDTDISSAKALFLMFSNENILDTTRYGQIIQRKPNEESTIYINGIKVASEENFLFSYNITTISAQIKKAINRERTNVGRSAYSETIKKILLSSLSSDVAATLQKDILRMEYGDCHDEQKWIDIQEHSLKILNSNKNILFITTQELIEHPDLVDEAKGIGLQIVNIPQNLADKIHNQLDPNGDEMNNLSKFIDDRNSNFSFDFISYDDLSEDEKKIYDYTSLILKLVNINNINHYEIKIAERLQESADFAQPKGICYLHNIIIKRSELKSLSAYSEVLIHEAIHASSGYGDVSRNFEIELSRVIGVLANTILCKEKKDYMYCSNPKENIKADENYITPQDYTYSSEAKEEPKITSSTQIDIKNLKIPFIQLHFLNHNYKYDKEMQDYILNKLKFDLMGNRMKEFFYYFVLCPKIPKEQFNEYGYFNISYSDYLNQREIKKTFTDFTAFLKNQVLLFSMPLMNEEQFKFYDNIIGSLGSFNEYNKLHHEIKTVSKWGYKIDDKSIYKLMSYEVSIGCNITPPISDIAINIFNTYNDIYNKYHYYEKRYFSKKNLAQ